MPPQSHPDLLVGFSSSDDAGVFLLPGGQALVQTVDFFTPIVDDPYSYGQIAAANALSDVYAMGGTPLTVLNIACFDPGAAPAEVWAEVLRGMADKTAEAGAVVLGGHSVEDDEPKFGMAVSGLVNPDRMVTNKGAEVGDSVWLSKPLGTGIVTTAAKHDSCPVESVKQTVASMATLNRVGCETVMAAGVRCGTDITGFGLIGHLGHIARESAVCVEIQLSSLPLFPGLKPLVDQGFTTGGAVRNRQAMEGVLMVDPDCPEWLVEVACDPQTSGGLCVTSKQALEGFVKIGRISDGPARVWLQE